MAGPPPSVLLLFGKAPVQNTKDHAAAAATDLTGSSSALLLPPMVFAMLSATMAVARATVRPASAGMRRRPRVGIASAAMSAKARTFFAFARAARHYPQCATWFSKRSNCTSLGCQASPAAVAAEKEPLGAEAMPLLAHHFRHSFVARSDVVGST